jgi:preprotein translocase subunit SecA
METLERIWEGTGHFLGGMLRGFERGVTSMFGSANARYLKRLAPKIEAINALEPKMQALSEAELKQQTVNFRQRLAQGETLDDILVEAFAVCREGGRRYLNMRHFDVQLIGGLVLHSGAIAEMSTGEGKTLVATLPAYLNALEGKGVHVVTVNDYLARRDMEWMGQLYLGLGLTVGAIWSNMPSKEKQEAYASDITYGTNNEFGFDYLRDNMRQAVRGDHRFPPHEQQSQRKLNFAIIDEVDNILIDEARTPLIISGEAHDDVGKYADAMRIARQLKPEIHFVVNEKEHSAHLTDEGVRFAEKLAGVESFYTVGNMEWPHLLDNALKALHLYKLDVNYVVKYDDKDPQGRVVIVDEFTGRLMEGRQWSDGLHQSVEAKEGVKIKKETQTLATITLQNYFKLYKKTCGMTGTAMTEATEFHKIYKLDVINIPTNRKVTRIDNSDVIYRSEREKFEAVANEIEAMNRWDVLAMKGGDEIVGDLLKETDSIVEFQERGSKEKQSVSRDKITEVIKRGRPILVGTVSIEKSERLAKLLDRQGVPHEVLNAKQHKREASIIAQAGRLGAVTIATNMAGRGTDIILGGNAESLAWAELQDKYATRLEVPREEWEALVKAIGEREKMKEQGEQVKQLGGLHVIGTERHEARRIDLQLRGRCGRQGDPGSTRFYLSLEDDLMRIFAGPWVKSVLERLGMQEGERIESSMVSSRIKAAQKKVEERHFDTRKSLLDYDEVRDEQRKRLYGFRQRILEGASCRGLIADMIRKQVDRSLDTYLNKDFGTETFAAWASDRFSCQFEARDLRGMDFAQAEKYVADEAERMAETQILDAIDENLPEGAEEDDWNWEALANFGQRRWDLKFKDRELKKIGRQQVTETLLSAAREAIKKVNLDDGQQFLDPDYGLKFAAAWAQRKFGFAVNIEELRNLDVKQSKDLFFKKAMETYETRERVMPVEMCLQRFTVAGESDRARVDRERLYEFAQHRFGIHEPSADFQRKTKEEIQSSLLAANTQMQKESATLMAEAKKKVEDIFGSARPTELLGAASGGNGVLDSLSAWMQRSLPHEIPKNELPSLSREELERRLVELVESKYRPEMQRVERTVLLQILDEMWKEHLLTMDRLRDSIGLMGYAQVDPKVEFKREGMRAFEAMWTSIEDQVTDLIFHVQIAEDDAPTHSAYNITGTHKQDVDELDDGVNVQGQANSSSSGDAKPEPIRNRGQRVGRNDPCPCGSGKKFKNCHMRQESGGQV